MTDHVDRLCAILESVPDAVMQRAAGEMGMTGWRPVDGLSPFAARLTRANPVEAAKTLYQFTQHFRADPSRIEEMVNLVASAWRARTESDVAFLVKNVVTAMQRIGTH